MEGFFSSAQARVFRPLPVLIPRCDRCGLYKNCKSPKMKVDGNGQRKTLIVGDYPGPAEDREGRPFAGGTGRLVEGMFEESGWDMRRDCWITNSTVCYSETIKEHKTALKDCRPNILRLVEELQPEKIILLGFFACKSVIGYIWKDDIGKTIGPWVGWQIPNHKPNVWILPMNNPAHLIYQREPVSDKQFRQHLRSALALKGRPWPDGPPDYARQVEVILDPHAAAARIKKYTMGMMAFDIETSTLKPDAKHCRIVSCSICWNGTETISYPWTKETRDATLEVLESPEVGKIIQNMDMECRWMFARYGVRVRNVVWDTMLAAHALDPRPGITGLDFQAFTKLGLPYWSFHIDHLLEGKEKGGYSENRIKEVGLPLLLLYGGLDSLVTWKLFEIQSKELGFTFS